MFTNFHHASYLVPDLDAAIASYAETFGGRETGRGTVPGLGVVGFVQVGKVEVEFIQPEDPADLRSGRPIWPARRRRCCTMSPTWWKTWTKWWPITRIGVTGSIRKNHSPISWVTV